jgi:Rnl2 family RNA ligase
LSDLFLKYPSIENHYQSKNIARWLAHNPGLEQETFVIQEKIHGANFQLLFRTSEPMVTFSRNRQLAPDESFFDWQNTIARLDDLWKVFQAYVNSGQAQEVRVFGELCGPGVQHGVDYGTEKAFYIFDVQVDGVWCTQEFLMEHNYMFLFMAPVLGFATSLVEAINFDVEVPSRLVDDKPDNIMEGVVIKPYSKVYTSPDGQLFYLKKKSERFLEVSKTPKPREFDSKVLELNTLFRGYINENRIQSVFSKRGPIERPQQMGEYIKDVMEDAVADFVKDNQEAVEALDDKQRKQALNVGSSVAQLLKAHL